MGSLLRLNLSPQRWTFRVLVVLGIVAVVAGAVTASASDHEEEGGAADSSTTTVRSSSSTTGVLPSATSSTTATTSPASSTTTQPPDGPDSGTDDGGSLPQGDGGSTGEPRIIPAEFRAQINSIRRTKPNNTAGLLDAVRPLVDLGMSEQDAAIAGFGQFPIAGYAEYSDDWWLPRFNPSFHLHEGTDVFAAAATPVRAPVGGTIRRSTGPVGGLAVYVKGIDGTEFYMAHLSAFSDVLDGAAVDVGDIVGFVGNSGNAAGGPTHVHFEVHPRGGAPVPPKPYLDRWIDDAIAAAPALVASFEAGRPRAIVATGITRDLSDVTHERDHVGPPRPQLLWATAGSPSGGALRFAEHEALAAAHAIDWDEVETAQRRADAEWAHAEQLAKQILAPLTPEPLRRVLGY